MKELIGSAIPFLASTAQALAAQGQSYPDHPHHWEWGWGHMIFGPFMMIVLVIVIVLVAVLALRWLGGHGPGQAAASQMPPSKTPLDILKERFARGEIDREDYEERKRVLDI